MNLSGDSIIGAAGAGTMGLGIAQVAATAGHRVMLFDADPKALDKAKKEIIYSLSRLAGKGKISSQESTDILLRIQFTNVISDFKKCDLVIEAIIENADIKKKLFRELEEIVGDDCILASNTSSLSITSIASACKNPNRFTGIHFFNPATLMPLVEVIPGVNTDPSLPGKVKSFLASWNKSVVVARDTPGFIVNRLARSFYGESIRIHEEGWEGIREGADGYATIDDAMRMHGFKMGPFELMDLIGNDINYTVTETVWTQFYYDPRYKPSLTQKRLFEAGRFGKKSGAGYYDYAANAVKPEPVRDEALYEKIFLRVISMLINEAADALYLKVASLDDLDLAMQKGVNYPLGLLKWCDEIGAGKILDTLTSLMHSYSEERYRPCILLKKMADEKKKFY